MAPQAGRSGSQQLDVAAADKSRRQVRSMLRHYGASQNIGRPAERVLKWAVRLDTAARASTNAEEQLTLLVPSDVRRAIFLLEGILKLYGKRYEKPMEKAFERIKKLEDAIGDFTLWQTMISTAKKQAYPAEVRKQFEDSLAGSRKALLEEIEANWRPGKRGRVPAIDSLVQAVTALDWDTYAADKTYVRNELVRRLSKVRDTPYDMTDLDQMHEFRRQLRWFAIYAEALDGLIVLDDTRNPRPAYKKLLTDPVATGPYAKLPPAVHESAPVPFSKSLYLAVRQLSDQLGLIKDDGEAEEFTHQALVTLGRSDKAAHGEALKLLGRGESDFGAQAKVIYDSIKQNRLLQAMIDELS